MLFFKTKNEVLSQVGDAAATAPYLRSPLEQALVRFRKNRIAMVGLGMVIAVIAFVLIGCLASPYGPNEIDMMSINDGPSTAHIFGCDNLGRDILTRIFFGGRISLAVGLLSAALSMLMGSLVGSLAGYYGGAVDMVLMRFTDFILTIPSLPLLMVLGAIFKPSPIFLVCMIAFLNWTATARLVRSRFLTLRQLDYIKAARATGESDARIILTHLLPNTLDIIVVTATLAIGNSIIMESTLSYLGCGINPPTASWGNMLQNAQNTMSIQPLSAIAPGLMILLTVLAFNFVGDGLTDALDPKRDTQ